MTDEQKNFLKNLLGQLTISPAAPDAAKAVEIVQGILEFLSKEE